MGEFLEEFTAKGLGLTIMGDLNIDLNKSNTISNDYIDTIHSVGFNALINQPTRIVRYNNSNSVSCSTIDHIITNSSQNFSKVGIMISDVSDHLPIFGMIKLANPSLKIKGPIYKRFFPESKKDLFLENLSDTLKNTNFDQDVNSIMDDILTSTKAVLDDVFPLKKLSRKQAYIEMNPWMTNEILKERKNRDTLKKKFIINGVQNSQDHNNWKKSRNKVNRMIKKAKLKYFENDFKQCGGDSGKTWKVIYKAMNKKPKPKITPDFVKIKTAAGNSIKTNCKGDIANGMNAYFSTIGENLAKQLNETDMKFEDYLGIPNQNSIFLKKILEIEIANLIQELNIKKSVGVDEIPPIILKWGAPIFVPILTRLFNLCITEGVYPDSLKIAKITPIFKSGNKNDISSYRPISILTQINRIFEKLLSTRLVNFFKPFFNKKQFGFRPKHETKHAVLDLKEHILEKCGKKLVNCILFLDLRKAFDSVSHNILLKKLEHYGVRGVALKLLTSYLTNRKQLTCIDDCVSLLDLIKWGVPQGSVLGPLLFLIYINDIIHASELAAWLFADDTVLVHSASNLDTLQAEMNTEVEKIQQWLLANKLSVHYVDKSKYMIINSNKHIRIQEDCFELLMGGYDIERTDQYKYLGVLVDEKLSWDDHIREVCRKLSQVAGVIFKIRKYLPKAALMLVYHSLVGSSLRYGLSCWGTACKNLLQKINVVHNRIVRYLAFSRFSCSRAWPLYCALEILPLDILLEVEWGRLMYQFDNNMLPRVFDNYFSRPSHRYPTSFTRQRNFDLIRINNAREQQMLKYIGPKSWANIPTVMKQEMSLKKFTRLLREHLIENYEND